MKFQDPPTARSGNAKHDHAEIAAELRTRPNEWALVFENTNSTYQRNIKKALLDAYKPAGAFEARCVTVGGGKFDIYARYVGGVDA